MIELPTADNPAVLVCGDAREILPLLPQGCIDAVITDPPYVVKKAVELRGKGVAPAKQRSTTIGDQGWYYGKEWLAQVGRVCAGHSVVFGNYLDMPELLVDRGQGELRGIITWLKPNAPLPAWNVPRYDTEFAVWWGKGNNPSNVRDMDSMTITCPFPQAGCFARERIVDKTGKSIHPSQKPLHVMVKIIKAFSEPGALILDPFLGSGTTALACLQTGRRCLGVEIDPAYHAVAQKRVADYLSSGPLFAAAEQPSLFNEEES